VVSRTWASGLSSCSCRTLASRPVAVTFPGAQRHQHLPQGGSALHGQGGRGGGHPPGGAGDRVDSQFGVDHPTPDCYLRAITQAGVDGAQVPVDQQGRLVQSQQRPVQPAQCPRVGGCVEHLDGGVGDLTAADPECVQCATQRRCRAIGQDGDAQQQRPRRGDGHGLNELGHSGEATTHDDAEEVAHPRQKPVDEEPRPEAAHEHRGEHHHDEYHQRRSVISGEGSTRQHPDSDGDRIEHRGHRLACHGRIVQRHRPHHRHHRADQHRDQHGLPGHRDEHPFHSQRGRHRYQRLHRHAQPVQPRIRRHQPITEGAQRLGTACPWGARGRALRRHVGSHRDSG